jgi:hypothetical protein
VRALRTIHSALRPEGTLVDIQPARHDSWVEIQGDDHLQRVVELDESPGYAAQHAAMAALQRVVDEGLFAPEEEVVFSFRYHFDSLDACLQQMDEWRRVAVSPELLAQVREALAVNPGELRVARSMRAARFRRL